MLLMKHLRWLREVRAERPSFGPSWTRSAGDLMCSNDGFASILHAVVCDSEGDPIYDKPLLAERMGVVVVAVDARGRIALLDHFRTAPPKGRVVGQAQVDFSRHGRYSLEFPRGLSKDGESPLETAVRETEEETGLAARDPVQIGEANQNTAYFLYNTPIIRVSLGEGTPVHQLDTNESIRPPRDPDGMLKTPGEIAALISSGQIICGLTKAAFVTHLADRLPDLMP
jgi:8-oxo-dGTP pyrophosphatase MutT (NUDIX family)